LALAGIAVGLTLAILKALIWSGGTFNAEVLGYALGAAILPALIAYAIAGRRKVRNPNRYAFWFMVLCLLFLVLEAANQRESVTAKVKRIAQEAAGTRAISNVGTGGDQQGDSLLRAVIGDVIERRKLYDQHQAELDPDLNLVGSEKSFSTRDSILRSMDVVRKCVAEDTRFSHEIETWPDRTKARVDASSLSNEERQQFMKGFQDVFGSSKILTTRKEAMMVEAEWSDATLDLYTFALKNKPKLVVRTSGVLIADEKVRTQFNQKIERYETLRKRLRDLNGQIEQLQQEVVKKTGVTMQDLGLNQSK
jgi:hypothetical protein